MCGVDKVMFRYMLGEEGNGDVCCRLRYGCYRVGGNGGKW